MEASNIYIFISIKLSFLQLSNQVYSASGCKFIIISLHQSQEAVFVVLVHIAKLISFDLLDRFGQYKTYGIRQSIVTTDILLQIR
jgi:hypothetical protein